MAAAAGRRHAPTDLHRRLPELLRDADDLVRETAIRSAGRSGSAELLGPLLDRLDHAPDRPRTREALTRLGAPAVEALMRRFYLHARGVSLLDIGCAPPSISMIDSRR